MRGRQVLALVVVMSVLGTLLVGAGVAFADDGAGETAENETAEPEQVDDPDVGESDLTLEQLRRDGTQFQGDDPSLRVDNEVAFSVRHWPDGAFANPGEDDNWRWLRPDDTVTRNSIWLGAFTLEETETLTLTIVYYDIASPDDENASAGDQQATNVVVDQQELTLGPGFPDLQEIDLRQSNEPRHVTMWVDGYDDVRWTFEHHSVATTQEVPFSTWGGAWQWAAPLFLALTIGGAGAMGGAKRIVKRTARGPGYGYVFWTMVFGAIAAAVIAAFWGDLMALLVDHPFAIVGFCVLYLFVLALETFENRTNKVRFIQQRLTDAKSPLGEEAKDSTVENERTAIVIDREDEPLAVASKGIRPFLARLFGGGAAPLMTVKPDSDEVEGYGEFDTNTHPLQCMVNVDQGRVDKKVFVHPDSPMILDYKRERLAFQFPEIESWRDAVPVAAKVALVGIVGYALVLVHPFLGTPAVAIGAAVLFVRPVEGYARVYPAPVHYRSAQATAIHLSEDLGKAETLEEVEKARIEERSERWQQVRKMWDEQAIKSAEEVEGLWRQGRPVPEDPTKMDDPDGNGRNSGRKATNE